MISDDYSPATVSMLMELGYEAAFMGDIREGDSIAIMEKNYTAEETQEKVEFLHICRLKENRTTDRDEFGDTIEVGRVIHFIAMREDGTTRHGSYADVWGIYRKGV